MPLETDRILQGDCVEMMDSLPEKSVDLVFADPPYNLQLQNTLWRPNLTRVDAVDDAWDHFATFEDYDRFTADWLSACRRVMKDTATLWVIGTYHNIYRVGRILMDLGFWILNDIVWVKCNPMPNFRGVRFTNAHETLIWAQKERGARYTFNYQDMKALNKGLQMRSDWRLPLCTGRERVRLNGSKAHSTQKPEALLERVLLASTRPGDLVLDPFLGSGTTGAVAKRLGRRWLGIERHAGYVRLAQERIDAVKAEVEADPSSLTEAPSAASPPALRRAVRVPLDALLKNGLLQAGQTLYLGKRGEVSATLLPDGLLRANGFTGTLHQVASALQQSPCNGWDHWYFLDESQGKRLPLSHLRRRFLAGGVEWDA